MDLEIADKSFDLSKSDRVHHIDVAKGIASILVVLGHCMHYCGVGQSTINLMIYSFHMPFFFFISGYLYKKKDSNLFFSSKVKGILLPLVIYSSLNMLIYFLLSIVRLPKLYNYLSFGGFWFLFTLLMTSTLYYFIDSYLTKVIDNNKRKDIVLFAIGIILLICGLVYAKSIKNENNQPIATTCVAFFFFAVGNMYKNYHEIVLAKIFNKEKIYRIFCVIVGTFLMLILSFLVKYNTVDKNVDMNVSRYGIEYRFVINALLGIFGLYFICFGIKSCKWLEWLGKNSLVIFLTHIPVWRTFNVALSFLNINGFYKLFLLFVFSLGLSVIAVFVFNRFIRFLAGKFDFENKSSSKEV